MNFVDDILENHSDHFLFFRIRFAFGLFVKKVVFIISSKISVMLRRTKNQTGKRSKSFPNTLSVKIFGSCDT